jgi:hypothetical protein
VFIVLTYHTSQYVVPRGNIFLGKWRSSFAGNSDRKMNVQSAGALNTRYNDICLEELGKNTENLSRAGGVRPSFEPNTLE